MMKVLKNSICFATYKVSGISLRLSCTNCRREVAIRVDTTSEREDHRKKGHKQMIHKKDLYLGLINTFVILFHERLNVSDFFHCHC